MRQFLIDKDKLIDKMVEATMGTMALAEISGLSVFTVNRLVNNGGIVRLETIGKLAKALNCGVKDLMKEE